MRNGLTNHTANLALGALLHAPERIAIPPLSGAVVNLNEGDAVGAAVVLEGSVSTVFVSNTSVSQRGPSGSETPTLEVSDKDASTER
jgi:hypothetical protein